ncbi:MAG: hypothetical protein ILNGONEN_00199 [Syntrophorhabdaceae bacterium]|nr:hypothetical protein [Syntrophorhabdaceae bacterium]
MKLPFISLSILLLLSTGWTQDFSVEFKKDIYRTRENVVVSVTAIGDLGIESDLTKSSFAVNVSGQSLIEIGRVTAPGFYIARFLHGTGNLTYCLVMIPLDGGKFRMELFDLASRALQVTAAPSLIQKFWNNLTKDRMSRAFGSIKDRWLAENAVGFGKTLVICVIPSQQLVCLASAGEHIVDLGLTVLIEAVNSMQNDGTLTQQEANLMRKSLSVANIFTKTVLSKFDLQPLVTGALKWQIEDPDADLMLSLTGDFYSKFVFLLKLKLK